jgi:uncharacterized tellurite resistance protein B-like protein
MNYQTVLTNLYFLLIHADGKVNESEETFGKQMIDTEAFKKEEFAIQIQLLKSADRSKTFVETLSALKKLSQEKQIRCIAWLCMIANADGFMDREEWQFIYNIYHKNLQLSMDDILKTQRDLGRAQRNAWLLS